MGRKKKEADPIFKPLESPPNPDGTRGVSPLAGAAEALRKAIDNPPPKLPPPFANYGADEKPRACIHCASKNSRVNRTRTTGRITIRARVCQSCGKNFVTREIAP